MGEFVKHTAVESDLTIIKEEGKIKSYRAVLCSCNLCGSVDKYKKAEILSGKVKRCKQCNKDLKIKKLNCVVCDSLVESRVMVHSKRFGTVCQSCYDKSTNIRCKSCETAINISNGNHSGYCKEHWNFHRVAYMLWSATQHRSKDRNLEFDLDIDWIKNRLIFCEVTGIAFELRDMDVKSTTNYSNRKPLTPSIDKIDSTKGYTKDNCRVVCWWYNLAKSNWDDDTVERIVREWAKNKELTSG